MNNILTSEELSSKDFSISTATGDIKVVKPKKKGNKILYTLIAIITTITIIIVLMTNSNDFNAKIKIFENQI